jgi:hypothetical protein
MRRTVCLLAGVVFISLVLACAGGAGTGAGGDGPEPSDDAATAEAKVGDITVTVADVRVRGFDGYRPDGRAFLGDSDRLHIVLTLTNGGGRTVKYTCWHLARGVRLKDDLGHTYPELSIKTPEGGPARINLQLVKGADLEPGKPVKETLVFEGPEPKTKHLFLTLPAANLGGSGLFKLKFPPEVLGKPW